MAILFCRAQVIKRSEGRSAVACAAYRCGMELEDRRTGQTHDYTRKQGVLAQGILAPDNAPEWARDPRQLWNRVEAAEGRKDAQLARELVIAIPHEIEGEHREYLIKNILRPIVRDGAVAQYAIHEPSREGDERNTHAHVMLTMRRFEGSSFGNKAREWNDKQALQGWKKTIERETNRMMERLGHDQRVSVELEEGQQATRHLGRKAAQLERKGIKTERGEDNRAIQAENERRKQQKAREEEHAALEREIAELEAEQRQERARQEEERLKTAEQEQEAAEALHWAEVARVKFEREAAIRKAEEEERRRLEEAAAAMRALSAVLKRGDALDPLKRSWESGTNPPPVASFTPVNQNEAGRAFTKAASSTAEPPLPLPQAPKYPSEQQRTFEEVAKPPLAPQEVAAEAERRRLAGVAKDVSALSDALDRGEQDRRDALPAFERLKRQWEVRAAIEPPSNENRPQPPSQPNRKTELGRSFTQSSTAEKPIPQAPKYPSEQQRAFDEVASLPEQPQRRQQGDGGDDSQTQANRPANQNKRRPRAQTAEEKRERMKNRSGRKRTRDRE